MDEIVSKPMCEPSCLFRYRFNQMHATPSADVFQKLGDRANVSPDIQADVASFDDFPDRLAYELFLNCQKRQFRCSVCSQSPHCSNSLAGGWSDGGHREQVFQT